MIRPPHRKPVVVLLSGRGSNMRALVEGCGAASCAYEIMAVLSDRLAAPGLELARALGVPARAVMPAAGDPAQFEVALAAAVDQHAPTLIALAGFMRILSPSFVARYAGRMLNIHPSLLPKYPGLHTHRRALDAHDALHGATVHFVTAELDGGPAIVQAPIEVRPQDNEESLAARVLAVEHRIYPLAVGWYCEGRLRFAEGRAWLDGIALSSPVQFDATRTPGTAACG